MKVLCDHMAARGAAVEYGPGLHRPGHTIFLYTLDPSGLRFEFYCEMDQIADESTFEPIVEDPKSRMQSVNLWGPGPPDSFLR